MINQTQTLKEFLENNKIDYKEENDKSIFELKNPYKIKLDFYDFLKLNYGIVYADETLKKDLGITIKDLKQLVKKEDLIK